MCVDQGRRRWAAMEEIVLYPVACLCLQHWQAVNQSFIVCRRRTALTFDLVVLVSPGNKFQTKAGRNQDQLHIYGGTEHFPHQSGIAEYESLVRLRTRIHILEYFLSLNNKYLQPATL